MRTLLPPAPGSAPAGSEPQVRELGRRIAVGQAAASRGRTRALEDRGMELPSRDPALNGALFRLVDVAPACSGPRDVAAHLASLLSEVERPLAPPGNNAGRRGAGRNLYVNRHITGAMVARQPFGGNRLSGTGSKAGGPAYLLHFVEPHVVTEDTMRHGLVV